MKVGDLVKGARGTSPEYGAQTVGIIVGINPLDRRVMVKSNEVEVLWSDGDARNHSTRWLEVISESR